MSSTLETILADLEAEGAQLDALVAPLDHEGWHTPTPAEGWDVKHQVAHLAWTDEVAVAAATDKAAWDAIVVEALGDPDGFVDAEAARGARLPDRLLLERWRNARAELVATLREVPARTKLPWFGPPMSAASMATARFMETWAHARDVAAGLGVDLPQDDRVRNVAHLGVRTRDFSFANAGRDVPAEGFRVELTLPGGEELAWGPGGAAQRVTGPAYDFALLVTQRAHRADLALTAIGPDADAWLDLAQAFAGPAGNGREPRRAS
ncbi:MAG: TIGR03084 family metal-binding protein [Nocardioidaceae bacterium]